MAVDILKIVQPPVSCTVSCIMVESKEWVSNGPHLDARVTLKNIQTDKVLQEHK